jgi:dTMP kinase
MLGAGKLVAFEGIDGSGKTTQARLFYESLRKVTDKCVLTREPSDSPVTKYIRAELAKSPSEGADALDMRTLQFLFIADRSSHVETVIGPELEAGNTVITDRYFLSTAAYGSAFGDKYGLTAEYLMGVNSVFPAPDIVFYIRVDPEVALGRVAERNGQAERFDNLESLRKLDLAYRAIALSHYSGSQSAWREIDGNRDQQAVSSDVMAAWRELSKLGVESPANRLRK